MQAQPVVLVVDDDTSMREGLGGLIAADGLQVECFASAHEFLLRPAREQPSCLVLDVCMPGLNGLDLQRQLAASGRRMPVIFITAHGSIPMVVRAMKAGALEFLAKPFRSEKLLAAIRRALEDDQLAIDQRAALALVRERRDQLTDREGQVLDHLGRGRLNKQIAADLGVTENTVKAHRRHIMQKMRASSLAELVRIIDRLAQSVPRVEALSFRPKPYFGTESCE